MDAMFRGDMREHPPNGVQNDKEEIAMYTKQEVIDMLNSMKKETDRCVGFVVGMVTKAWVYEMIDEKIQEVMNRPEPPDK